MGKIIAYCRKECPHSNNTAETLLKYKTKYNIEINYVENIEQEKNRIKTILKPIIGNHNTFPIILYLSSNRKYYLIGGNLDLQNILDKLSDIKSEDDILKLNLSKGQTKLMLYILRHKI